MSSPIRTYFTTGFFTKTKTETLINLTKVSRIELNDNTLKFIISYEKDFTFGSVLLFAGGGPTVQRVTFDTQQEAKKEFDDVRKQLEDYYKK